jgi:hypothetical protein
MAANWPFMRLIASAQNRKKIGMAATSADNAIFPNGSTFICHMNRLPPEYWMTMLLAAVGAARAYHRKIGD